MARLLDEFLLLSQAKTGKLKCKPLPMELEKFCRRLVEEAKLNTRAKDLTLTFNCQERDRLYGSVWDESLLKHILHNLLDNAIKYSPAGARVQFDLSVTETAVTFQFQDKGLVFLKQTKRNYFSVSFGLRMPIAFLVLA